MGGGCRVGDTRRSGCGGGLVNQSRHRAGPHAHRYPWESPALSVLDLAVTYIMYADAAERPSEKTQRYSEKARLFSTCF